MRRGGRRRRERKPGQHLLFSTPRPSLGVLIRVEADDQRWLRFDDDKRIVFSGHCGGGVDGVVPDYSDSLTAVGLALDVCGALMLAKGLMAKRVRDIAKESGTYFDENPHFRDSLVRQRVEAWIGGGLLVGGFMLQLAGQVTRHPGVGARWLGLSALVILVGIVSLLVARRIGDNQTGKLDNTLVYRNIINVETRYPDQVARNLSRWGAILKVPRQSGESDTDYFARLKVVAAARPRYPEDKVE